MSFSLGWYKRDDEGHRVKVDCNLVRNKLTWRLQTARFERWEPMKPDEEDWEKLLDTIDRNLRRGKVDPTDAQFIKRLHKEQSR